eukprot:TRINITY_DN8836_c0_g3_i1.p1 TRINITY_DN8836_c0_g3~~TRINITY_DN8836_c0_g3_i1.p1  ORF type:complete len:351 (-),score=82.91 TRINITY_DN8836_c0_g3_i1:258-1310(-)
MGLLVGYSDSESAEEEEEEEEEVESEAKSESVSDTEQKLKTEKPKQEETCNERDGIIDRAFAALEASLLRPENSPLPAIEALLPKEWHGDRLLLGAWQKGRNIAAAGGVAWGNAGSEVAAISSRSEEAPRAVDLATMSCSCPNPRGFCSHLYAAVQAAGCESLRGRAALFCLIRERSRDCPRTKQAATETAAKVLLELANRIHARRLCALALDAVFRLRCASQRHAHGDRLSGVRIMPKDAPGAGDNPGPDQLLWIHLWGSLPGTGRLGSPVPADGGAAARAALSACLTDKPGDDRPRSRSPRASAGSHASDASVEAHVATVLANLEGVVPLPVLAQRSTEAVIHMLWNI